ncbi:MAG: hypothetical protein FWC08_13380 [Defluviitaleaceae bacterium]|nr:hypothetical protein [Defluviitaleaceae bacterium]
MDVISGGWGNCKMCRTRDFLLGDTCVLCVLKNNKFWLEVSFSHTKSKKFESIIKQLENHRCYFEVEGRHTINFFNISDFLDKSRMWMEIIPTVSSWKTAQASFCGIPIVPKELGGYLAKMCIMEKELPKSP